MYLKFGQDFADFDLEILKDLFTVLDSRMNAMRLRIDASFDSDSEGLFD